MRFSANTGFLFKDLPFLERIAAAAAAGFDAVEFHDEAQGTDPERLAAALAEAGLPVVRAQRPHGRHRRLRRHPGRRGAGAGRHRRRRRPSRTRSTPARSTSSPAGPTPRPPAAA